MLTTTKRNLYLSMASLCLVLAFLVPVTGFAAGKSETIPKNAIANKYSSGWVCMPGFLRRSGACDVVQLPANAYLNPAAYRNGWSCHWGFREIKKRCEVVVVPAHAYLSPPEGKQWRCERGYKPSAGQCVVVEVPENAHIDFDGDSWTCNRPYRRSGETCANRTRY